MAAGRTLRTAHFLMFIGVAPLLLAAALALAAAHAHPGQAGASDAFLMLALILSGCLATPVLGGAGLALDGQRGPGGPGAVVRQPVCSILKALEEPE